MGFPQTPRWLPLALMMAVVAGGLPQAWAEGYPPEAGQMQRKGYSPFTINTTLAQRLRQEWREQDKPKPTWKERFYHNVYYSNWVGDIDEFGAQVIDGDR